MATPTSTARSGIRSGSTAGRCRAWPRDSRSAASPSPMRMPRRTPTRTRRSIRPTARSASWYAARDQRWCRLARAPGERREVAVVAARGVVPVDAEPVHVAAGSLREREPTRRRMAHVVEVDRLVPPGARDALDRGVVRAPGRHPAAPAHPLPPYVLRLRASYIADHPRH